MSSIRHEGGVNWNLAVVRNVGTGGLMERERLKRWTRQSQSVVQRGYFDNIDHELLRRAVRKHTEVKRAWRYWLNRRSGHHAMPWERFNALVNRFYALPPARVVHSALAAKP